MSKQKWNSPSGPNKFQKQEAIKFLESDECENFVVFAEGNEAHYINVHASNKQLSYWFHKILKERTGFEEVLIDAVRSTLEDSDSATDKRGEDLGRFNEWR